MENRKKCRYEFSLEFFYEEPDLPPLVFEQTIEDPFEGEIVGKQRAFNLFLREANKRGDIEYNNSNWRMVESEYGSWKYVKERHGETNAFLTVKYIEDVENPQKTPKIKPSKRII